MAKIVIVSPSQPSRTPRLVRNADALASEGHEVIVINPLYEPSFSEFDQEIINRSEWKYLPVQVREPPGRWIIVRAIRRIMFHILSKFPIARFGDMALLYGSVYIMSQLKAIRADMYIAQQQSAIPLVAKTADKRNVRYGCDLEDVLTESRSEPKRLLRAIEDKYLPHSAVTSTMSAVAAEYYIRRFRNLDVLALHNCSAIAERNGVEPPLRISGTKPSIYWFGQTLGPHSLAVELLRANAAAGKPFRLCFRGNPIRSYVDALIETAQDLDSMDELTVLPLLAPEKMVIEASQHDVLFGSQPSRDLFHQLAIGNKVFTGILAGCALLLSSTEAHIRLKESLPDCVILVNHNEEDSFSETLLDLGQSRERLLKMRKLAWQAGTNKYHWELECRKWCESVNAMIVSEDSVAEV